MTKGTKRILGNTLVDESIGELILTITQKIGLENLPGSSPYPTQAETFKHTGDTMMHAQFREEFFER